MLLRLEQLGRFGLDPNNSGIDSTDIWTNCVAPFHAYAMANRDTFLTELRSIVADDRGGFATFGAARLVWELYSGEALHIPAALPLIDAGIAFKQARGLPTAMLTGYEMQRLAQLRKENS